MTYYAIISGGEDIQTGWRVARNNNSIFERYNPKTDDWLEDRSLFLIYAGEPETETITESQAYEIIERIKSGEAIRYVRGEIS